MKKVFYFLAGIFVLSMSSCCTLFTSSKQTITFTGESGIRIYDKNKKITEINEDGVGTARIRKKISNKTLMAKKEGYKNTPFTLESEFNPVAVINLFNAVGWAIDFGTQKCFKWEDEVIEVSMDEKTKR